MSIQIKALPNVFFNHFKTIQKIKDVYKSHPVATNCTVGFLTFTAGDLIAQKLENSRDGKPNQALDVQRSRKLGVLGSIMNGLLVHKWFVMLDKVVRTSSTKSAVAIKVAADQLVFAPFALVAFFGYALASEPESSFEVDALNEKVKSDFMPTYMVDCSIWPLANIVNFKFVPLMYRATFTAVMSLVWQTYLSFVTYDDSSVSSSGNSLLPSVSCDASSSSSVVSSAVVVKTSHSVVVDTVEDLMMNNPSFVVSTFLREVMRHAPCMLEERRMGL